MTEKFFIGPNFKARIQDTIRFVESMPARVSGGIETTVLQEINQPPAKTFRVCTFTGAWSINSQKVVTFANVTSTPNTAIAYNALVALGKTAGSSRGHVVKEGTAWYLTSMDLTTVDGYATSGTHVMSVVNGNLQWVGTTSCL